jgi:signal transduction histidine kinase
MKTGDVSTSSGEEAAAPCAPARHVKVADFIADHQARIIEEWKTLAKVRLALELEQSELLTELPCFIRELVLALRSPAGSWPPMEAARSHGQHRLRIGMDIGGLTEEMTLVGETILDLAKADGVAFSADDVRLLLHAVGRGTAASVRAYASLRDRELATQAAEHYSFVAHEIRTPLHTARLCAALILSGQPEDAPKYQARLERALLRVSELVDNSIVHARLQGRSRLVKSRFTTREVSELARDDVEDFASARGMTIVLEIDEVEVDADLKLVCSALTNMLRNAIKFSCQGGRITLRVSALPDRVLFEVEDACGGIPEEIIPRLFQPFVQEGKDRSGFGLGLRILKEAAEAHDGSIRVANRPGTGCTFIMDLPLQYEEAPDSEDRRRSAPDGA